jgi:DNA-binding beta-propeller fold protein YncE
MRKALLLATALLAPALAARADIAISSNDPKVTLLNGNATAVANPPADTATIIDLKSNPPKVIATIDAPGSVAGPPQAVAISADESWAIITAASKQEGGKLAVDSKVSVIDLKANPPKVVQTLDAGAGATSVRFTPDEKLVLIANRAVGTISVFTVKDRRLEAAGTVDTGNAKSGPSGIVVLPDGKRALLTRDGDHMISLLHINGAEVKIDPRPITSGLAPYTMDINNAGTLAAVGNMGRGNGDFDTVQLIDLKTTPPRVVTSIAVPPSPEGVKFSPDGRFLAIGSQNGSNKAEGFPFRSAQGLLTMYAVDGINLRKITQAPIGAWPQGFAFSRDGRTLLAQSMTDRALDVFRFDGTALTRGTPIKVNGGAASIGTPWR